MDCCQWEYFPIPMQERFFVANRLGGTNCLSQPPLLDFSNGPYLPFKQLRPDKSLSSGLHIVFFADTYPLRFAICPLGSVVHLSQLGPAG